MNHKQEPHKPVPFDDALRALMQSPPATKTKPVPKQINAKEKKNTAK